MTLRGGREHGRRIFSSERQLVNDPQVSFFVKDYVSRGVSVQGAVETPGVYQMIQQRTLLEILGEAGGLSGRENDRAGQQIFVIRKTADGQQTRIEIDAEQLVNQGRADLNIALCSRAMSCSCRSPRSTASTSAARSSGRGRWST